MFRSWQGHFFVEIKNVLGFFWAYFVLIANNFVEDFFQIRALFRRETSI
jgi:hypothetical protein